MEFLLFLLPVFMIIPVLFVVLLVVSLRAKRREAMKAAVSPEAQE